VQPLTEASWWITVAFVAGAVLGFLYMLAIAVGRETKIHELRIEVVHARNKYVRHMRGEVDEDLGAVDIVNDNGEILEGEEAAGEELE